MSGGISPEIPRCCGCVVLGGLIECSHRRNRVVVSAGGSKHSDPGLFVGAVGIAVVACFDAGVHRGDWSLVVGCDGVEAVDDGVEAVDGGWYVCQYFVGL